MIKQYFRRDGRNNIHIYIYIQNIASVFPILIIFRKHHGRNAFVTVRFNENEIVASNRPSQLR